MHTIPHEHERRLLADRDDPDRWEARRVGPSRARRVAIGVLVALALYGAVALVGRILG